MRENVAGASGAIGRRLVRRLIDAGHEVIGTTAHRRAPTLRTLGATPVELDLLDARAGARPWSRSIGSRSSTGDALRTRSSSRHRQGDGQTSGLRTRAWSRSCRAGEAGCVDSSRRRRVCRYARAGRRQRATDDPLDPRRRRSPAWRRRDGSISTAVAASTVGALRRRDGTCRRRHVELVRDAAPDRRDRRAPVGSSWTTQLAELCSRDQDGTATDVVDEDRLRRERACRARQPSGEAARTSRRLSTAMFVARPDARAPRPAGRGASNVKASSARRTPRVRTRRTVATCGRLHADRRVRRPSPVTSAPPSASRDASCPPRQDVVDVAPACPVAPSTANFVGRLPRASSRRRRTDATRCRET